MNDESVIEACEKVAKAIRYAANELGTNGAVHESGVFMGALEFLGLCIKEAGESIGSGLRDIAEAIREGGGGE